VAGKNVEDALSFHSAALGDMKLSWAGIRSIEFAGANTNIARLTATNGDTFAVTIPADALRVETGFGQTEMPVKLIRSVKVAPPAGTAAAAATGAAQLAIELRDGSRVIGKGLDDTLTFHSTAMGDLKLAWAGIRSIEYAGTNTEMARLTATNGDVYEVQFAAPAVRVETSFGKTELPVKLIRSVKVSVAGVVMRNLIGWWKLDDGSGTVAKDSSQNPHDGTLVNGPAWTRVGRDETCLQFSGANQYVSLGNILQDGYTELSIACWVKHTSTGWNNIVERGFWGDPDGIGLMMDYNTTSVSFGFYFNNNNARSKANAQDGQWHHVVGTLSKGESGWLYSIYVDGKLDNTQTGTQGLAPTSKGWAIGARYDGSFPYRGLIEDVRIYDRALSLSEVQAIYEERNHGEPTASSSPAPAAGEIQGLRIVQYNGGPVAAAAVPARPMNDLQIVPQMVPQMVPQAPIFGVQLLQRQVRFDTGPPAADSVEGQVRAGGKSWERTQDPVQSGIYVEDILQGRLNQPQGRGALGKVTATDVFIGLDHAWVDFGRGCVEHIRVSELRPVRFFSDPALENQGAIY
jgi:hypothetical protein